MRDGMDVMDGMGDLERATLCTEWRETYRAERDVQSGERRTERRETYRAERDVQSGESTYRDAHRECPTNALQDSENAL